MSFNKNLCSFFSFSGAFLIPFAIMLILEGIPLFLIELGMGQKMRLGSLGVWNTIHPWLGGIGIASCVVTFFVALYYNVIITWCFYYLFNSLRVITSERSPLCRVFWCIELQCHHYMVLLLPLQLSTSNYIWNKPIISSVLLHWTIMSLLHGASTTTSTLYRYLITSETNLLFHVFCCIVLLCHYYMVPLQPLHLSTSETSFLFCVFCCIIL